MKVITCRDHVNVRRHPYSNQLQVWSGAAWVIAREEFAVPVTFEQAEIIQREQGGNIDMIEDIFPED